MSLTPPTYLIFGHSFVRRLKTDQKRHFDLRAIENFGLEGTAVVHMHGVGGRTVKKLRQHDIHILSRLQPDIVILDIGTNDLSNTDPVLVGSEIEEFVQSLLIQYKVKVVELCHVTARGGVY